MTSLSQEPSLSFLATGSEVCEAPAIRVGGSYQSAPQAMHGRHDGNGSGSDVDGKRCSDGGDGGDGDE